MDRRRREQAQWAEAKREERRMGRHCSKNPRPALYIRALPSGRRVGPGGPITSRNSRARTIRGEKGGAEIEVSTPYPIRVPWSAPLRALPKIQIPQNPLTADQSVRRYLSCDPTLGSSLKFKSSLDRRQEWIKATEVEVDANAEIRIADPRYDIIKVQ